MSAEPLQPARQQPSPPQFEGEEIRGSAWMQALQVGADVGGIAGGVAAVKSMMGGSGGSGDSQSGTGSAPGPTAEQNTAPQAQATDETK